MNEYSTRRILLLIFFSMGLLVLLSNVPWSDLTGNYIKDFNLLSDICPKQKDLKQTAETAVPEIPEDFDMPDEEESIITEDIDPEDPEPAVADTDTDTIVPAKALVEAPLDGDIVLVESYLPTGEILPRFKAALANSSSQVVRIAMLGDSYIEGDIMSQDLRDMFQGRYGGRGVGFVPLHSDFPGFRSSVRMSDTGWKLYDVRTMNSSDTIRQISGDYAVAENVASTTYKGSSKRPRTKNWDRSSFLFLAPDSARITLTTDAGSRDFDVMPSPDVQSLDIPGTTSYFKVSVSTPGLVALGAYLDSNTGVLLDCMSIRGNSGLPMRRINPRLSGQLRQSVDYDLIILEYGMNSVNAAEQQYTAYGIGITKLIIS